LSVRLPINGGIGWAAAVGMAWQSPLGNRPRDQRDLPWRLAGDAHLACYGRLGRKAQVIWAAILGIFSTKQLELLSDALRLV
jgi:hypothetical protein